MVAINSLLSDLDERVIAHRISIPHDEVRIQYHPSSNTVSDFDEFGETIANYYNYHNSRCIANGGMLARRDAYGKAKTLLEHEYRRKNGNIVSAFNDCRDGTNGGLRNVLDIICNGLKEEAIELYVQDCFDRHVAPNSWDQKVDIIRQFISCYSNVLSSSIVASQPERYAHDYSELIRSFVENLRQTSAMFRRL
jgi:hypothetical protein